MIGYLVRRLLLAIPTLLIIGASPQTAEVNIHFQRRGISTYGTPHSLSRGG
jgi:hypothetical protein